MSCSNKSLFSTFKPSLKRLSAKKTKDNEPEREASNGKSVLPTSLSVASKPLCLRFLLVGKQKTGKKMLAYKFATGTYDGIIPSFMTHVLETAQLSSDAIPVRDTIWGLTKYNIAVCCDNRDVTLCQYTDSHIALLCFDLTNRESFHDVRNAWFPEAVVHKDPRTLFLVGLKADLKNDRNVTWDEIQQFCSETGCSSIECSSKTDDVDQLFRSCSEAYKKLLDDGTFEEL